MKRILLISALLAFLSAPPPANAYTVENMVVSETGGVSERAHAEGSLEASAEVRSMIRTEGSNTRVRIDTRITEDGIMRATSSGQLQRGDSRVELRISPDEDQALRASSTLEVSASTSPSRLLQVIGQFRVSLERIFRLVFFFW